MTLLQLISPMVTLPVLMLLQYTVLATPRPPATVAAPVSVEDASVVSVILDLSAVTVFPTPKPPASTAAPVNVDEESKRFRTSNVSVLVVLAILIPPMDSTLGVRIVILSFVSLNTLCPALNWVTVAAAGTLAPMGVFSRLEAAMRFWINTPP